MASLVEYVNNPGGVSGGGTAGTLSTQGFYQQPAVPNSNNVAGQQGTDGRGYTRQVQSNELVQNQMNQLMNRDGAYIQNARRRGTEQANKRGMLNSSIAAGSAERAAIESAMPIATQDANTFAQAAGQNLDSMNSNLMQEREISNRMVQAGMDRASADANARAAVADAAARRQLELQMQRERLAFDGEQQGLSRQQQEYMARLGYDMESGLMGQNYGYDLGRAQQGFGFQSSLMGQGYGYDIGRMGAEFNFGTARDASQAQIQDWLSGNQFNREFMGGLATMAFANRQDQFNQLWTNVLENPEVYGNQQFLQQLQQSMNALGGNFDQMIARMFGGG